MIPRLRFSEQFWILVGHRSCAGRRACDNTIKSPSHAFSITEAVIIIIIVINMSDKPSIRLATREGKFIEMRPFALADA